MKRELVIATLPLILAACTGEPGAPAQGTKVDVADTARAPLASPKDAVHANAFRPLDGRWEGTFTVYVDTRGQQRGPRPSAVTLAVLDAPPYRKELELRVRQDYLSESPTFQRVSIRDTYPDGRVVVSEGVNKVQDGLLYCVVRKPDDLVIHTGSRPTPDTIIWQRDRSEPLALEWFKETVSSESYTIVGWGYYGSDDPTRAPRTFFHARYVRPKVRPQ